MDFSTLFIEASYLIASMLFILGLRGLSHPESARRGMLMAEIGMLVAVIGTLLNFQIITYTWIIVGLVVGSLIGTAMALRVPMTAMPQRTALSHAFGALAAALVGIAEYALHGATLSPLKLTALGFEVVLGGITFTGSLLAFAKLHEMLPGAPITFRGQNIFNMLLLTSLLALFGIHLFFPMFPFYSTR